MQDKAQLRIKYKSLRKELSQEEVENKSIAIANKLLELDIWDKEFYHIFLSIAKFKEINTEYILNILNGKDKNIVISKSNLNTFEMQHFLLNDTTRLKINDWGIPEPQNGIPIPESSLEVIFIPLLAFDSKGNRVGYGKGFYDRFLAKCNPNALKIGLSFFKAETEISTQPDDIKLTHCITVDKIYQFDN